MVKRNILDGGEYSSYGYFRRGYEARGFWFRCELLYRVCKRPLRCML